MTCAVISVVLAGLAVYTTVGAQQSQEMTSGSKVRIGTFDSRCLAMGYYRSEMFKSHMLRLKAEYEKAKAAGDKKRVKEMEARSASGIWPDMGWPPSPAQQDMMHKQGFSTWPVDNILEKINGKIPEIAKQADVDVIISKWDLAYQRSGVELVDVTPLLVKLLVKDEKALKAALEIRKMHPIPRETLMDPND
jgi:hypothetical protein